jgi:protein O-GlcNAc transferase
MNDPRLLNALSLRRAGRVTEAARIYGEILESDPANFEALHAMGVICYQAGRLMEAERLIADAIAVRPAAHDAIYNRACLLTKLDRLDEALSAFNSAITLKPDYLEALVNRGTLLARMGRPAEALESYDRVLAMRADIAEVWCNRAGALFSISRFEEAAEAARRAVAIKPGYADAWKICGNALCVLLRFQDANEAFEKACALAPADAEAWHRRGVVLQQLRRIAEALAAYERAVAIAPDNLAARSDRANLLFEIERFEEAAADYAAIESADPNRPSYIPGYLTLCRMKICDWKGLDEARAAVAAGVREGLFVIDPMGHSVMSSSAESQLLCARIWTREKFPPQGAAFWAGPGHRHERIRIAYVSSDFRTHAVASLIAGVFDHHDRANFEVTGLSYGPDDGSPMRRRLEQAFDRFIDIRDRDDTGVTAVLREMEIDIAIDLTGYTGVSRTGLFARRIAPVQVNYLGFPSTMGAEYMDYIIADRTVIPPEDVEHYSEQVVWLPDQYQANDRKRALAPRIPSREEAGLPANGFVYCCFNNNHKITPEMFSIWMRLLAQVEGSVLWLYQDNSAAARNLRREAQARGISGERLIFAPRVEPMEHLARHTLADLFLDTLPYNAHTTASDALWTGIPIITVPGATFAGRVATSLVTAAGVPELAVPALEDYEQLALALARDPERLRAVRDKILRNRETCALFDTEKITRYLEAAYRRMHERHRAGEPPAGFAVPP